jgi:hypothetical protein
MSLITEEKEEIQREYYLDFYIIIFVKSFVIYFISCVI